MPLSQVPPRVEDRASTALGSAIPDTILEERSSADTSGFFEEPNVTV